MRRRQCLVPTWRGWLLVLGVGLALFIGLVVGLYPFLAVNDPLSGGALVVEGWAADSVMEAAVREYQRHPYTKLYVTGIPLERGAPLAEYETYAELGAATVFKLGLATNEVQAVPAPRVRQDRTYASAVALRQWLQVRGEVPGKIHLVTEGAHARRSRLLFQAAFGPDVQVGVTAWPSGEFDPARWWRFSAGFRGVTGEAVAYLYAKFLFP